MVRTIFCLLPKSAQSYKKKSTYANICRILVDFCNSLHFSLAYINIYLYLCSRNDLLCDEEILSLHIRAYCVAGGEVFRATSSPWYYLVLALLLGLTVYLAVVMYRMLVRQTFTFSVLSVVLLILLAAVFVYLICRVFVEFQKRKSYLIIDKEGIRGTYVKAHRFPVKPQFRNVNIRWDELTDVKVSCEYNTYLDFYNKRAQLPYKSIYLEYLPTRKVIDCINFFYAHHAGITKQPALIKPTPFEDTNTFTFLLISFGVLVLCYLVY